MATTKQRERLRKDIGATLASLPDADADDIFEEAGEDYTNDGAIKAATRVIAIRRLLASSAKLTTYRQNASQEKASDVFKHLNMLRDIWQEELEEAVAEAAATGAARFGGLRRKPKKIREYPD